MFKIFKQFIDSLKRDFFAPVFLIIVYILFIIFARGIVPTSEEIIDLFARLYQKYGYEIIFLAALSEGLIIINFFVPGMVTMAFGVIFARAGNLNLTSIILSASLGSLISYILDYLLGRFGFSDVLRKIGYKEFLNKALLQLNKFKKRGLILGFAYPNIASFLSLAVGTAGSLSFVQFVPLAALATLVWYTIWGLIIYALGDIVLVVLTKYSFVVVLAVLSGWILLKLWNREEKQDST